MARTGIDIRVANTVIGAAPEVDSNSMLIVVGATPTSGGSPTFNLNTPIMLRSLSDLDDLNISESSNEELIVQVRDYYSKAPGSILWIVGTADETTLDSIPDWVRETVRSNMAYRPRQIALDIDPASSTYSNSILQIHINELYEEGFATVGIIGGKTITGQIDTAVATMPSLDNTTAPMVGTVIVSTLETQVTDPRACVGLLLGHMASLPVGTSVGAGNLQPIGRNLYFMDNGNTPCSDAKLATCNSLGDKGYIFARTRMPKNGLWFNDGATGAPQDTALSSLELGRTIASIVDSARDFFVPYINQSIPVTVDGDMQPAYKQVVLDNARGKVIQPYIDNGDISDARLLLTAMNNDMVGTRTWEFSLSILPAPSLRWIDGFVFYVSSLN